MSAASVTNVMMVGVGGQGSLLASRIMGDLLLNAGLDAKVSEVHGMAQRGGSVVTYIRYGEKVFSPIVDKGEADVVIAFEELEALRWAGWLRPGGVLVMSGQHIPPMPVLTGKAEYPAGIGGMLADRGVRAVEADALGMATAAGSPKAANVALLGVTARFLPFSAEQWLEAVRGAVKPVFVDVNVKAFMLGYEES